VWRDKMDRTFPDQLKKLHSIEIDYADGEGIDFEPYDDFCSQEETSEWIKAWTGNSSLNGHEYLIFGQDGSGGYAAFWLVANVEDLLQQPIVFFGSEGEVGVVAQNFGDYVWLFAHGLGPYEAVASPDLKRPLNSKFLDFAQEVAPSNESSVSKIISEAKSKYPNFEQMIDELCQ
ncbi:hypothetical protein NDJ06_01350, partial [Vibrio alginolyticus]